MNKKDDIWFPAKKYGYGWGLPVRWEAWVVLAAYLVLMMAGSLIFLRRLFFYHSSSVIPL